MEQIMPLMTIMKRFKSGKRISMIRILNKKFASLTRPTILLKVAAHAHITALAFEHIEFGFITLEMAFSGVEGDTAPETFTRIL